MYTEQDNIHTYPVECRCDSFIFIFSLIILRTDLSGTTAQTNLAKIIYTELFF